MQYDTIHPYYDAVQCDFDSIQQIHYIPYTFHGSFKVKCPESGAITHVQYVTVARF